MSRISGPGFHSYISAQTHADARVASAPAGGRDGHTLSIDVQPGLPPAVNSRRDEGRPNRYMGLGSALAAAPLFTGDAVPANVATVPAGTLAGAMAAGDAPTIHDFLLARATRQ